MTEQELKNWFWDKFNSCYPVNIDGKIFMIYDINCVRKKKLANILDKEFEYPTEPTGKCIFILDFDFGYFVCDFSEILYYLRDNGVYDIDTLLKSWLKENKKLKRLIPMYLVNISIKNYMNNYKYV
jgi:hypothetical protein